MKNTSSRPNNVVKYTFLRDLRKEMSSTSRFLAGLERTPGYKAARNRLVLILTWGVRLVADFDSIEELYFLKRIIIIIQQQEYDMN